MLKRVRTRTLEIAYEESGPRKGPPVLLLHGWPYDPRAYDAVVPRLAGAGCRVIVPTLRGFGRTRFLSRNTLRSGQQAAKRRIWDGSRTRWLCGARAATGLVRGCGVPRGQRR